MNQIIKLIYSKFADDDKKRDRAMARLQKLINTGKGGQLEKFLKNLHEGK